MRERVRERSMCNRDDREREQEYMISRKKEKEIINKT